MGKFIRNHSLAITWDSRGCRALRLEAKGGCCRVAAHWQGEVGKDGASVAELLPEAVRALNGDDSIYVAVAGEGGWSMNDIAVPATLKGEDLRNALAFELAKQTPLPQERIKWGYRITGSAKDNATRNIRLFFVKNDTWDAWLKAVNGLHHVDAMLPAPANLDPLLAEAVFAAPATEGSQLWTYIPDAGKRKPQMRSDDGTATLGNIFPEKIFQPGSLAALSREEQLAFAPAVLLGMYALTPAITADAATLPALPERLVARRHIAAKMGAALLLLYLLGLMVFIFSGYMQDKAAKIRIVEQEISKIDRELKEIRRLMDPKAGERISLLRQELVDNAPAGPGFPAALLEITRAVGKDAWISNSLEWKEGSLNFQIQTPTKDMNLAQRLEYSEILGDVSEKLSTFNQSSNSYTQRFEMTARFDTPEEAQINRMRREKEEERQRQRLELEQSAAAAEEENAQDAPAAPKEEAEEENGWDD